MVSIDKHIGWGYNGDTSRYARLYEESEMKSKIKWYSILVTGVLLLVLTSSVVGCGQSQSEAYQEGYKAGFTDGYEAGVAQA